MKWLYNLKVWQKLILLGFLFSIPFGAVVAAFVGGKLLPGPAPKETP